jgi:hypothetical protein
MAPHENSDVGNGTGAGCAMNTLSIGCAVTLSLFVLFLLFCVCYTVKSAFGLDIFPGVHLKDIMDSILNSKD